MNVALGGYARAHDFRKSGCRFRAALKALQRRLGFPKAPRRVGDAHDCDPCVGNLAIEKLEGYGDARQREVAKAARDFLERPAGVRSQDRKLDLEKDLFGTR